MSITSKNILIDSLQETAGNLEASRHRAKMQALELEDESHDLMKRNRQLTEELAEARDTIAKQKELLKEWMRSQMTFKLLFKKYGVVNGQAITAAPQTVINEVVDAAHAEVDAEMSMQEKG